LDLDVPCFAGPSALQAAGHGSTPHYTTKPKGSIMLVSKSKVYELALSSIKEQHISDFLHGYLPNISPILSEYGGRFLINGIIQKSNAGRFPAKSFAILEWPSIEQFIRINEDERVIPLIQTRNQYLDFIAEGCFYRVLEDNDIEFPRNKTMNLLLTDRVIPDDGNIRFQWIDDVMNSKLSLNMYFSGDEASLYDEDRDVEELSVQVL
jgi:uncharacterized protein (DUF1330 family)